MGDFKEIVTTAEKRGGRFSFTRSGFSEWIDSNKMVDMGFIGPKFTWMTRRGIGEEIWVRMDRALCTLDWRMKLFEGFIRHLPRVNFDHCPILLKIQSQQTPVGSLKPFWFEAMWMKHNNFADLIKDGWNSQGSNVFEKILNLSDMLKVWNGEKFGNLFCKKNKQTFATPRGAALP